MIKIIDYLLIKSSEYKFRRSYKKISRILFVANLRMRATNLDRIEEVHETRHRKVTILKNEVQERTNDKISE